MTKLIHGRIRGKIIELTEDLGLADGQEIEIAVRSISSSHTRQPGEGLLRTEGALADDTEWDIIMEQIHRSRKLQRRLPTEES